MSRFAIFALAFGAGVLLPGAVGMKAAPIPVDPLRIGKLIDQPATTDGASPERDKKNQEAERKDVPIEEVCAQLADAAQQHGLPVSFLARLIWQESRFDQRAVSPVGAQGLAQFMPRTAAEYGLDDPFDPLAALPASARFLRELHDQFGNLGLAAAAYNAGAGRIQNWLARRGKLPEETRNYVKIITGQPPEKWTIEDKTVDLVLALPARAPCEGVAGLSRNKETESISVNLTDNIAKIVQVAEAEAARAVAAAKELARKVARVAKSGKARAAILARRAGGKITIAKSEKTDSRDKSDKIASKKSIRKNIRAAFADARR